MSEEQIPQPGPELFGGLEEVPLEAPEEFEDPHRGVVAGSTGLRMVMAALGQRGVCESGQNGGIPLTRYVRTFWPQSGPQPWCAFFVSWCYLQTTRRQPPWSNKGLVNSVRSWAQGAGTLHSRPQQGDMFGIGGQHMGLVRGVRPDSSFITIEGNTSSGCVRGFVRPAGSAWFAGPR